MHLAIIALAANVPSIGISYNGYKMKGTFSWVNMEDYVLKPLETDKLYELYRKGIKNKDKLKSSLENKQTYCKMMSTVAVKDVVKKYKNEL